MADIELHNNDQLYDELQGDFARDIVGRIFSELKETLDDEDQIRELLESISWSVLGGIEGANEFSADHPKMKPLLLFGDSHKLPMSAIYSRAGTPCLKDELHEIIEEFDI